MATETIAQTHTPGPWEAQGDIVATKDGRLAIDCTESGRTHAEDCANARLIAAVPDLLTAARGVGMLYAELFAAVPGLVNTPAWDLVQSIVRQANAAVAKAEGRE